MTGKADLFYRRIEHNVLLDILRNEEILSALAYMVDFSNHSNFEVIPKDYSIEISNENITIVVIIYVGFESEEYEKLKNRKNLHLVTFSKVVPEMVEFEKLNVKYIDNLSLLFMTLSITKDHFGKKLFALKNIGDI